MKDLYPAYFHGFHCIAADCPDSCCQGWDVVIDEDTDAFYRTVKGELGEKLREAVYTDSDGDRVFRLAEQKKCPFWGKDKLCDIYRELGEERLCATCAQFPRITMDYTTFTEHTLALACPEAARLILTTENATMDFTDTSFDRCGDYPADIMRLLLDERIRAAAILTDDLPLWERLENLHRFAEEIQTRLTGARFDPNALSPAVYEELEFIDVKNRTEIIRAAAMEPALAKSDPALTRLALYWLYRYWLTAIDTLDVIAPIRFLAASVGVVANLAKESGDVIAAAQMYSKEIEQSYENMERLMRN